MIATRYRRFLLILICQGLIAISAVPLCGQSGVFDWSSITEQYDGVRYIQQNVTTPRNMRISVIRVDLEHPDIRFDMTERHPDWGDPIPDYEQFAIRTERKRSRDYLIAQRSAGRDIVAAVNASPWKPWGEFSTWDILFGTRANFEYAGRLGLNIRDGQVIDYPHADVPGTLLINNDWTAEVVDSSPSVNPLLDVTNTNFAVSGFEIVLSDGNPSGQNASVDARTAYGLSQDKRYLILMTIDGDTSSSVGATEFELAQWLQHYGSWDGINMDGGGSSTMVFRDPASGSIDTVNVPAESGGRRVGNSLGVYFDTRPSAISLDEDLVFVSVSSGINLQDMEVGIRNDGGGVLSYSATTNSSWLSVDSPSAPIKGSGVSTLSFTTWNLAQGTHTAIVSFVNEDDFSQSEDLTLTLEVGPPGPGSLPFQETFESISAGTLIGHANGWQAEDLYGIVQLGNYTPLTPPGFPLPEVAHSQTLVTNSTVQHPLLNPTQQDVKVDLMISTNPGPRPASMPEAAMFGFIIDEDGLINLWHMAWLNGEWTPSWTILDYPAVAANQWLRLSVELDFSTSPIGDVFFRPRINGSIYPSIRAYRSPSDLTASGPWYMTANNPARGGAGFGTITGLRGEGILQMDDIVVTSGELANTGGTSVSGVPFTWFDQFGIPRQPDVDIDADGFTVGEEYASGTDPIDPDSYFRVTRVWVQDGLLHIEFTGNDSGAATPFLVETSTTLTPESWVPFGDEIERATAPAVLNLFSTDYPIDSTEGSAFFRIRTAP